MVEIHPTEIKGKWDVGYGLDQHTISSTFIGYNEFGHPEFDTVRSPLGELVYRLKYKSDRAVLPEIADTVDSFLKQKGIEPHVIVPMPPSRTRLIQPVVAIAVELGKKTAIEVDADAIHKATSTQQMKDIGDFSERVKALTGAFTVTDRLNGKNVLLLDDLYQSGATMNVVAELIKKSGGAALVYSIAMTRTRI